VAEQPPLARGHSETWKRWGFLSGHEPGIRPTNGRFMRTSAGSRRCPWRRCLHRWGFCVETNVVFCLTNDGFMRSAVEESVPVVLHLVGNSDCLNREHINCAVKGGGPDSVPEYLPNSRLLRHKKSGAFPEQRHFASPDHSPRAWDNRRINAEKVPCEPPLSRPLAFNFYFPNFYFLLFGPPFYFSPGVDILEHGTKLLGTGR